tara:strand:- start:2913 stop:4175 length:1263 start_codon:yes stop_codon:yes gene_type:complete
MKFGIIGSGGREHAICSTLTKSKNIHKIYCFPGNAGTSKIAENIQINSENFEDLKKFIIKKKIDYIVVGPEGPLVNGIVDYLEKSNIKVFGPNKIASQLEGSKIFTKELCEKYNIPTAKFGIFKNIKEAKVYLDNSSFPIVIKADGLAAGKGVYICENKTDAIKAIKEVFAGKFGKADKLLIEEFLEGEEMSFFIVSDGQNYKKFGTAQDHKRVFEGDKGPNTGGMGAYSPSRLENNELDKKIIDKIIEPTLKGLKDLKTEFKGFLYAGLIIINNEPFLIEYNVRMGDPECQTILPKLKSDFGKIIEASCNKKLDEIYIDWHDDKTLCIVLCSKGYPEKYKNNIQINFKDLKLKKNEFIFHAGTKYVDNKILSNGGRVLNFVIRSNDFKLARKSAIRLIHKINWENGFFRNDIGYKVIDK